MMASRGLDFLAAHESLHTKARTFYSYDLYLDNELGLEVKDDAISITEFKAKNKNMLVFLPKQRKSQNLVKYNNRGHNSSTYEVVGSWGPFSTPFCTQLCKKKLVLSILEGVKENLEDGSCFDQFDEKDLVVRPSGKVLFRHVKIVAPTYEAKRAMWKNTYNSIKTLFGNNCIPEDIGHLLDLINKQVKEPLYIIHPSLELHCERGWFFNKMYEHVKFKITKTQKDMILLKLPYHDKWRILAKQNAVLEETVNFRYDQNGCTNYEPLPKFNEKGLP